MKPYIWNANLKKLIISLLAPYNWSGLRIKKAKNAYLELQDGKVNVNTNK
jgi:hypothetical protein